MKKLRPSILPLLLFLVCLLVACSRPAPNEATITMKEMAFRQSEITVKAGQPVTLRLVNRDGYAHAFDIDEFDFMEKKYGWQHHHFIDSHWFDRAVWLADLPGGTG